MRYVLVLLLLTACTTNDFCRANGGGGEICSDWRIQKNAAQQQTFTERVNRIPLDCEAKREKGIYKTYSQQLRGCEKPQIMKIYTEANFANMDLLNSWYAKRIVVAEKREKGQITQVQAEDMLAQFEMELANTRIQRETLNTQQQESQLLQSLAIQKLTEPAASNKIHCSSRVHSFGLHQSLETDCD